MYLALIQIKLLIFKLLYDAPAFTWLIFKCIAWVFNVIISYIDNNPLLLNVATLLDDTRE